MIGTRHTSASSIYWLHILLLYVVLCASSVCGQNADISFDHLTVEQGLSQSTVFAMAQDSRGFIWIGTRDGLNRYDSHEVKVYKTDPKDEASLAGNVVNSLLVDSKGRLWVATTRGLCLYRPETDNFERFVSTPGKSNSLSNNNVSIVFEDREKNLWVGTHGGLDVLVNGNPERIHHFYHDPQKQESLADNDVRAICQDADGDYWIGTMGGLSLFKSRGQLDYRVENFAFSVTDPTSLSNNWINTIIEGDNQTLWIGTEKGGLNIFDRKTRSFWSRRNKHVPPAFEEVFTKIDQAVRAIKKDNSGQYWIGSLDGLFIYNPLSRQLRDYRTNPDNPSSLSNNSVRSILVDRDGSFWLGTHYGGVNYYSPVSKQFDHFTLPGKSFPLRFKIASALYEDFNHNLWLGIDGEGVIYWDRQKNTYKNYKHNAESTASLSNDNIKCIYPDGHEGLWIGTFNGLNYFSFATGKITQFFSEPGNPNSIPNDRIYDIQQDKEGNFWIATHGGGLCRFNKSTNQYTIYKYSDKNANTIQSDVLTCLKFDSKNRLWIGAADGLNLQMPGGKIIRFNGRPEDEPTVAGKFILFIFEDHLHQVWVGTRGGGLFKLNEKTLDFKNYTTANGLPGNNTFGIEEDDRGYLWISTDNGISKFDPGREEFKNYNLNDGLACKEFNYNSYFKDHEGKIYFGGYNGIVIFQPDNIKTNTSIPSCVFTRLRLFGQEVQIGADDHLLKQSIDFTKTLRFRYDQNVFTVEFSVLNYINPGKNQYAYKLEGFEKDWNIVSSPVATYMNLSPGKYTLLVKGCNNNGIWNEKPITLSIRVLPPPWKTWWAYLLYIALISGIVFFFSWLTRTRLNLEKKLYLEHLENEKQKELNQTKLRFFTNISHEIRTPLTLIISPLEYLVDHWQGEPEFKRLLQTINNNAQRLLRLTNQLLDFRKQETGNLKLQVAEGNIVKFISEIVLAFNEYAALKGIKLVFNHSRDKISAWYDRSELEKVFFNLLSNAFKFVPEKNGLVEVSIREDENWVYISTRDNGSGISDEFISKIFDRFYQVDNSEMKGYGFGIGLSLSKGIVRMHHGDITVKSSKATEHSTGETEFTVKIPLGKEHFSEKEICKDFKTSEQVESYTELEALVADDPEPTDSMPGAGTHRYTLLIVDDNVEIRNFLRDRLKEHYTILEAKDGEEAWKIATADLPDLIISDIIMPLLDGIALTRRLKKDERTSHIPVILLTARNARIYQLEGLETEADEYLTKPFNIRVLELKIRNILNSYEKLKSRYSRIVTLEPGSTEIPDPEVKFLHRLMEIIEKYIGDPDFNVARLVEEIGMSRPVLFRKLKALTDMSIIDLIRTTRLKKSASLLKQKKMTISEVSYAVGFTDSKYFSKAFRQQYGKTPTDYIAEN